MEICVNTMLLLGVALALSMPTAAAELDLSDAVVVVPPDREPTGVIAATVLGEEVQRRSGIRWPIQQRWPEPERPVIALAEGQLPPSWSSAFVSSGTAGSPLGNPEAYALSALPAEPGRGAVVAVLGGSSRGVLFGVGRLLRSLRFGRGSVRVETPLSIVCAPDYPLRGHQLGYRAKSNTYDAWTPEQFDRYIRELALFGANAIEGIPFQDLQPSPLMQRPRAEMNRILSEICAKYDLDYWVWTPADFPLSDVGRRQAVLREHEVLYQTCPRLDNVFVPGGDPGHNPPQLIIPFVQDLARLLTRHHPRAGVWLSLQGFDADEASYVLNLLEKDAPPGLRGLVAGPGSPPIDFTRRRLAERYALRWYPDIGHTIRCQHPVAWWDPAFALTLGREPPDPRAEACAEVFRTQANHTCGFITYSEGINDDVNKIVWSLLGWDARLEARGALTEYARFFFGADVAESAARGLDGLERNWSGGLAMNEGVDGVLETWRSLETREPRLAENWRFQLHLMRAYYDAYTRQRLIYESTLEQQALEALHRAPELTSAQVIDEAIQVLRRAETQRVHPEWRARIRDLAGSLFRSVGYQTSVDLFHASGPERGCIVDFLDHPLNNRWWLEDEFARIRRMDKEEDRLARLELIRTWAHPGPGGFYDDVGNVANSPRVLRALSADRAADANVPAATPEFSWRDSGRSRHRLSWQTYMRWPAAVYADLDTTASYTVRVTGQGDCRLRADSELLEPSVYSGQIGEFKEFPVPVRLTADGRLRLTWDEIDESHLNWREQSFVAEVWLLKR